MTKGSVYTWVVCSLFLVSLAALGHYVFYGETAGSHAVLGATTSQTTVYQRVAEIDLGPVDVKNYQRMGFTRGIVKFSPDGKWLGVGTENGQLMLFTTHGNLLWRKANGLGKLTAMEFSADSQVLYVGENSVEGNLYCFDINSGQERWKTSSAKDIGADIRRKSYPGIVRIVTDKKARVYALAQRHEKVDGGQNVYRGKIYCLTQQGRQAWEFPVVPMDAWVNWMSVDDAGQLLTFGTANFEPETHYRFDKNIYGIDAELGIASWDAAISPQPPYERTILRGSPNLAADGRNLAALASDGRAFLFDSNGSERWRRFLSQPKEINGVYLNALGRDAYVVGDRVVFATINTYNNANWQMPTPVEHPSGNSLFLFSLEGSFVKKWQAGGSIDELAFSSQGLVAAIGRNTKTKDLSVHGLVLLRLSDGEIIDRIASEGPCIATAISPDGRFAAGIEAPIQTDSGTIVGKYRLILIEKRQAE